MSLPLLHAGRTNPGLSAQLDLRFALDKSLTAYRGPTPSFSRASTGTYFNSSGVLTSAAINSPRFNHTFNGTSWVSRGLLVEEQRTNLFLYSNDFSNASWNKNYCSITSSATTGPDGTTSASALVEDSTTNYHDLFQRPSGGTTAGVTYTFSAFIKAAGRTTVGFYFYDGGDKYTNFNLSTETVGTNTAGNTATITNVGNGWYRCSITRTIGTSSVNGGGYISSGGYASLAGLNATGYYIYGAQIEVGAFPTSYIPTTSASSTRSADVCQITGTDFSGFWNGTEGSIACEFDRLSPMSAGGQTYPRTFMVGTSGNNFIDHFTNHGSPYNEIFQAYSGGAQQFGFGSYINTGITTQKYALAFASNDSAVSCNGTAVQTDNTCTVPTVTANMSIGYNLQSGSSYLNGHIARLRYFNKRLPNATLQQLSDPDPTLNLQFALNKTLTPVAGPAPSFSRASTGTYFNASGVLTSASINTPRFDHVYSGGQWVSRGLLLEEQRTNLIQYSDISTDWIAANATKSSTSETYSPDGGNNAKKLVENSANSVHGINANYLTISPVLTNGLTYTASCFVKSGSRTKVMINSGTSRLIITTKFDLNNSSVISSLATSSSITNVGNGWFRISATGLPTSTGDSAFSIHILDDSGNETYTGNGSGSIYLWGYQVEQGSFPTSYIPTTTTSVVRSADVCQITGTSFNWMWNQGEGSYSIEYNLLSTLVDQPLLYANNGSVGESHRAFGSLATNQPPLFLSRSAGVTDGSIAFGATPMASGKIAIGAKVNDLAGSLNGGAAVTDSTVAMPVGINQLLLGIDNTPTRLNGHIAKLIYYPARLANTKLQQLST